MRERRSEYDVTNRVRTTDPTAVSTAVAELFCDLYPGSDPAVIDRYVGDFTALYAGERDGYDAAAFVEEFLRITALVHDIGHGPFCHFFDDNFLHGFGLSHEKLGQIIVREHLGPLIKKIRRSPSGQFERGEELNPDHIAHVILKEKGKDNSRIPRWISMLQPVISGSYTADNLDYVLRDAYMCGVAVVPVDLTRLIHYTIVTDKGFTIHKTGLPALQMFLNTRMYLYSNVYYHRTTRAIDIHLRDIFGDTMKLLFASNPAKHMDEYLTLTDWSFQTF